MDPLDVTHGASYFMDMEKAYMSINHCQSQAFEQS